MKKKGDWQKTNRAKSVDEYPFLDRVKINTL